jgi:gas vesicle protein
MLPFLIAGAGVGAAMGGISAFLQGNEAQKQTRRQMELAQKQYNLQRETSGAQYFLQMG